MQTKMQTQSQMQVHNFKPRRHRLSKALHQRVLMDILANKIDAWDVRASPVMEECF